MKKYALFLVVAAAAGLVALFVGRLAPSTSTASSHREAPLISEDPTADNTDLYAFRSPDKPSTFTIVSNWIPGEDPAAGPNYYTFSQSARYNIYVDRNGDGRPDVTYTFRFKTPTGPYFLGNTQQSWTATRNGKAWASGMTPIDNIGPRFNGFVGVKNYEATAEKTIVHQGGVSIFAGQRDDPFFADVGAIFDLVAIRKAGTTGNKGGGKDFLSGYNVHTNTPSKQSPGEVISQRHEDAKRAGYPGPPDSDRCGRSACRDLSKIGPLVLPRLAELRLSGLHEPLDFLDPVLGLGLRAEPRRAVVDATADDPLARPEVDRDRGTEPRERLA
jgi:Domain of unknown function (DUF4331)